MLSPYIRSNGVVSQCIFFIFNVHKKVFTSVVIFLFAGSVPISSCYFDIFKSRRHCTHFTSPNGSECFIYIYVNMYGHNTSLILYLTFGGQTEKWPTTWIYSEPRFMAVHFHDLMISIRFLCRCGCVSVHYIKSAKVSTHKSFIRTHKNIVCRKLRISRW